MLKEWRVLKILIEILNYRLLRFKYIRANCQPIYWQLLTGKNYSPEINLIT